MHDFLAQMVAELRALGIFCLIHGPEAWLALVALCIFGIGVISGLFLAALLGANLEDNDK
jgi:uncharacterized SAM-binding protein YcdF (DUF218 family)